jgi:hypothetical protein
MFVIYIKPMQFFKNVDEFGNIFEINYPTRKIIVDKEVIEETYDNYIENGFTKLEMEDVYKDCRYSDFNEDLTFNVDKYNARKEQEKKVVYESEIVALIRKKYTIDQELAILRQRDTKPQEFDLYNDYVEQCKVAVKEYFNV